MRKVIKSLWGNPGIQKISYLLVPQTEKPEYSMQPNGYVLPEVTVTKRIKKPNLLVTSTGTHKGAPVRSETIVPSEIGVDYNGNVYLWLPDGYQSSGRTIFFKPEGNDTIYGGSGYFGDNLLSLDPEWSKDPEVNLYNSFLPTGGSIIINDGKGTRERFLKDMNKVGLYGSKDAKNTKHRVSKTEK